MKNQSVTKKVKPKSLEKKTKRVGWLFILPVIILITIFCFYPMVEAFLLSLKIGKGNNLKWNTTWFSNYIRMTKDPTFWKALKNTFFYLIVQVPVMLVFALLFAFMLNDKKLKFKGIYRTLIFLPCATSLVSSAIIFKQLFSTTGFINSLLLNWGWIQEPVGFLTDPKNARLVIIITMLWRWTGYNMIFYLAGLQNIDNQVYEAARIDGASIVQQFSKITVPLLKPVIVMTAVLSTNGTLQLFDEIANMTMGGPADGTITFSYYIYKLTFRDVPQFGYASAISYIVMILVAILAFIQMKVGAEK